jgi:hypothetical protein
MPYLLFLAAAFFLTEATTFFADLAGLDLPKEPLNIFPFLVFISPRPIITEFYFLMNEYGLQKKQGTVAPCFFKCV